MPYYGVSHRSVARDEIGEIGPENVGILVTCVSMGLVFGVLRPCISIILGS